MQCSDAKGKIQLKDNFKKVILPTISQSSEQLKKKREWNNQGKKKRLSILQLLIILKILFLTSYQIYYNKNNSEKTVYYTLFFSYRRCFLFEMNCKDENCSKVPQILSNAKPPLYSC